MNVALARIAAKLEPIGDGTFPNGVDQVVVLSIAVVLDLCRRSPRACIIPAIRHLAKPFAHYRDGTLLLDGRARDKYRDARLRLAHHCSRPQVAVASIH
jgi:hypothetical protein